jgi:hypothetical protein
MTPIIALEAHLEYRRVHDMLHKVYQSGWKCGEPCPLRNNALLQEAIVAVGRKEKG